MSHISKSLNSRSPKQITFPNQTWKCSRTYVMFLERLFDTSEPLSVIVRHTVRNLFANLSERKYDKNILSQAPFDKKQQRYFTTKWIMLITLFYLWTKLLINTIRGRVFLETIDFIIQWPTGFITEYDWWSEIFDAITKQGSNDARSCPYV